MNYKMERRNFLQKSVLLSFLPWVKGNRQEKGIASSDRTYWVHIMDKIAAPILKNMSKGELRKNMIIAYSPTWDHRASDVAYMEAFGRLLIGIGPFLALPDDVSSAAAREETNIRKRMKEQTLAALRHAADPLSPDYLYWGSPTSKQPLVDAAFIAQAFLIAPTALWEPLSAETKMNYIREFTTIRQITPPNNNWVLFAATIESFLLNIGKPFDAARIDQAIAKIQSWYVGDGWYKDGEKFHFDHYNGFVIHPMLIDVMRVNLAKGRLSQADFDLAYKRMQRYASFQERYISPEGTFLVVGRSSTYRVGLFQPLAKLALENALPEGVSLAQVRSALTAVFRRVFVSSTFDRDGWLTLGLVGANQANIADSYSNTGSMYLTSAAFLPLGLPASHSFWTDADADWTQKKAWTGQVFPKDYAVDF
ncbi:DUF2264 domain-containing protein [Aquirufa regiilacus]|uniref:DUF2264 domain-containing protein n=1 Tax=Aquirufa regiilacus TaxID=3024868 RepID=A0ABU3TTJ7_9BACT|nr:DUF2264 domain-containing protein [Aquirufa sp. LEOWEIH-7C]MDU0809191.1 DUF2264 domain-containing protein [Aquirufa sp. LEOWEIH-7C]